MQAHMMIGSAASRRVTASPSSRQMIEILNTCDEEEE
jgi:hypothetical protein